MSKEEIKAFMANTKVDQPATVKEFTDAVLEAYKDRTRQVYFIWRKLKELYPDVDANRVIREGSYDFGLFQGEKIAGKYGGGDKVGPKEALLGQTSRGGLLVFKQKIEELSDEKAVKLFHRCPHVEALADLGLTKEEIKAALRKATISNEIVPVVCGSSYKNRGVQKLLDAIVDYMPAPTDVESIKGINPETEEEE